MKIFYRTDILFTIAVQLLAIPKTLVATKNSAPVNPKFHHPDPDPNIPWDSFSFSLNGVRTDYMWLNNVNVVSDSDNDIKDNLYSTNTKDCLVPLGPLPLHPTCTVLNYGQGLFEGLKAFRRADGSIALFRPEQNALRMLNGADRILLPPVSVQTFLHAADAVVRANAKWVPPHQKGALYLRPLLFGSGEDLGVKPSSQSTFCIYSSPVGNYFKGGLKAIRLQAVRGYSRAAPGGSGGVKAAGNYAPAFLVQQQVRQRGYDEALFLDAVSNEAVEEAGASNFFAVYPNNTIVTPPLSSETILPGITRASIMELAKAECQCEVVEKRLTLTDLKDACEAFCCGTGASITPVGCVSVANKDGLEEGTPIIFGDGTSAGPLTESLYKILLDLQMGTDSRLNEKYDDWIHIVEPQKI